MYGCFNQSSELSFEIICISCIEYGVKEPAINNIVVYMSMIDLVIRLRNTHIANN